MGINHSVQLWLTMKRSNDDEPEAKEPTPNRESAKKQKVNDGKLQPQLDLMPKIPSTPPTVPLTQAEQDELKRKYRHTWQTIPPPVYRSKDYNLWPKISYTIYRSQVNIHNSSYASNYCRFWFAEHEGLREPPPNRLDLPAMLNSFELKAWVVSGTWQIYVERQVSDKKKKVYMNNEYETSCF